MAIHIGLDLVDVARFRQIFQGRPDLIAGVFTIAEREACAAKKDSWRFYAERFAVKEACLKALKLGFSGTGIDLALREVEYYPVGHVGISLRLHGWVAKIAEKRRLQAWRVSTGYCHSHAIAAVVLLEASLDGYGRNRAPEALVSDKILCVTF